MDKREMHCTPRGLGSHTMYAALQAISPRGKSGTEYTRSLHILSCKCPGITGVCKKSKKLMSYRTVCFSKCQLRKKKSLPFWLLCCRAGKASWTQEGLTGTPWPFRDTQIKSTVRYHFSLLGGSYFRASKTIAEPVLTRREGNWDRPAWLVGTGSAVGTLAKSWANPVAR